MNEENVFKFAGSIGGQAGSGGGSIGGRSSSSNNSNLDCIIVESLKSKDSIVYIQKLRNWRDEVLLQSTIGRVFVRTYYFTSPKLVKLSRRVPVIKKPVAKTAIAIANLV